MNIMSKQELLDAVEGLSGEDLNGVLESQLQDIEETLAEARRLLEAVSIENIDYIVDAYNLIDDLYRSI